MFNLDTIIDHAADEKVSDIHLIENRMPFIRKNGILSIAPYGNIKEISHDEMNEILSFLKLSQEQHDKLNLLGDIDLSYSTANGNSTRINIAKGNNGINIAMRIIAKYIPTPDELHLPLAVRDFITQPHGLVLLCGPTGCGKSTTLASLINHVNKNFAKRIVTIEEPIEYYFPADKSIITQREIGRGCQSFSQGLKSALRQDPDIIMVGELRDAETIATALSAAETGHLVLSTLHTGTVIEAIDRLVQYFSADQHQQIRNEIANALVGIAVQKLYLCKKGGRIAAFEVLVNTSSISNLIRKNEIFQFTNYMYADTGMQTMQEAEALLVRKHLID